MLFVIVLHLFCLHYFLSSDLLDHFVFYVERVFFIYWFYFRDLFLFVFLLCFCFYFVFIYWYFVFHEESWMIVEVLRTSEKVIPEWFFLTFFGVIKSVPDKFFGIVLLLFLFVSVCLQVLFFVYFMVYVRFSFVLNIFCFLFLFICFLLGIISVLVVLCFPN